MRVSIPCLYAEYGRYIDKLRAIPYHVDCLKPVERRLLVSLNTIAGTSFQKSAKVVGHCIGNYHPHGDMSTYGALVQLVKRGWVIGQGNFGSAGLEDSGAAAQRYTEVKLNPHIKAALFEYIKYVPWKELELDSEPLYLPSIIPIGLVGNGLTQGIGFHTVKMPQYNYPDLINRLYTILTNGVKQELTPNIMNCKVAKADVNEFENILQTGKGSVWCCPDYNVYSSAIDVLGKNPINGFSKLKNQVRKYSEMVAIKDLSSKNLCVRVYCKVGSISPQFEQTVIDSISAKINYICNVVNDDGRIVTKSIDELLLGSYTKWKEAWLNQMKDKLGGLERKRRQLEIIKIVRECYDPSQKSVDDIVNVFTANASKYQGFTVSDIKNAVNKGKIKELIEAHLDFAAVEKAIQKQEQEISDIDNLALGKLKGMIV